MVPESILDKKCLHRVRLIIYSILSRSSPSETITFRLILLPQTLPKSMTSSNLRKITHFFRPETQKWNKWDHLFHQFGSSGDRHFWYFSPLGLQMSPKCPPLAPNPHSWLQKRDVPNLFKQIWPGNCWKMHSILCILRINGHLKNWQSARSGNMTLIQIGGHSSKLKQSSFHISTMGRRDGMVSDITGQSTHHLPISLMPHTFVQGSQQSVTGPCLWHRDRQNSYDFQRML